MNKFIITKIISAAFVIIVIQNVNLFSIGKANFESRILCKEDSLKWMIYTLNHTFIGTHYRYDSLPKLPLISCEVIIWKIDTSIKDTVVYNFNFYKGDLNETYSPREYYYSAIGYSNLSNQYFPIPNVGFPVEINDNAWANMIKKSEEKFKKFIQTYKGELSIWLKTELIRKKS